MNLLCFISYQLIVRFLFLLILNHISGMFLLKQEHEVPHRYSLPTKALQLDHYYFQSFKLSSFRLSCHRDAHRFGQLSSKNWPQPWPLTISMTIDHIHDLWNLWHFWQLRTETLATHNMGEYWKIIADSTWRSSSLTSFTCLHF